MVLIKGTLTVLGPGMATSVIRRCTAYNPQKFVLNKIAHPTWHSGVKKYFGVTNFILDKSERFVVEKYNTHFTNK